MLSGISTSIVVVDTVLPVLAILAVVLRLLARRSKSQSLEVDDFLILVALVDRPFSRLMTCSCVLGGSDMLFCWLHRWLVLHHVKNLNC